MNTKLHETPASRKRTPGDPKRIGKYKILRRLGEGGMGVVYLAAGAKGTNVALKVIRQELAADSDFRVRFAREVEAASKVGGTCTAQVLDADPYAERPYLVTEYCDGLTLDSYIQEHGPLQGGALAAFAVGLSEALVAIHSAGLVHRDLKPSNILLTRDGPRIIDFGIARAAEATAFTLTGTTLGTPAWMAPEQARGKEIGPAADVFAWGSLIAYAATGEPPFGTGTPEALLYRVVHEAPRIAGVPDELQKPVEDSLRKSPDERPDANALLRRCLGDETVTDADETTSLKVSEIMDKTWRLEAYSTPVAASRRVKGRILLLLVLGLALVGAAVVVLAVMPDEQRPPGRPDVRSVSTPQSSPAEEAPPDARDVPIRQLLRPGTAQDKVVIGDMDSQSPEEIVVASSDVGSDPFMQRYLDIYSWNGSRWKRIFDATNYVAPDADGTVLPFGTSVQGLPGRSVDFLRLIDFHGDGAPELAAGISSYGASSGPLDVWILSKIDRRVRSDFHSITERGGSLRQRDDVLELETGSFAGDDPMCCPSFIETSLIGSEGGVIKVLDTSVVDSPNALKDIDEFPLQLDGIGPVRVGMTLDEAADALGTPFEITFDHGSCKYAQAQGFKDPALMLLDGRIARVDVYAGSIRTISGIGIGSTEQEVFDTYGSQIRAETHPYDPQGNYLIYVPQDANDQELSMTFETDGSSVTSYRSGFEEAVAFIEGCV